MKSETGKNTTTIKNEIKIDKRVIVCVYPYAGVFTFETR